MCEMFFMLITLTLSLDQWTSHLPTPILLGAWSILVSASVCPLRLRICGAPPVLWSPTSQTLGPGSRTVMQNTCLVLGADLTAGLWIFFKKMFYSSNMIYHLSKHAEGSLREGVELLFMCRQTQPHVDSNLDRHLQALGLVHGVLTTKYQTALFNWQTLKEKI